MAELDQVTVGELFKLLGRLRPRTLFGLIVAVLVACVSVFDFGRLYQESLTAISLNMPFGMQLPSAAGEQRYPFGELILTERSDVSGGHVVSRLRHVTKDGLYDDLGEITAQRPKFRIPILDYFTQAKTPISNAYAQSFEWGRYRNNHRFVERFISPTVVRRTYDDGAELEYRVDGNGRSIVSSLRWIKRP